MGKVLLKLQKLDANSVEWIGRSCPQIKVRLQRPNDSLMMLDIHDVGNPTQITRPVR